MSQRSQRAVSGGDHSFYNGTGADIAANRGVLLDSAAASQPAVKLPSAAGGVVGTIGVTVDAIKNGAWGRVRLLGSALMTADGAITAGDTVQISDTAAKMGSAKVVALATRQLGIALSTAADGAEVEVWIDRAKNA